MIPQSYIIAWGTTAPWPEQRQIEQDLIISRALVDLFSDGMLKEQLRFRGGTALNKLHFPAPLRYSEDIDLVRTKTGPIGPILDQTRKVLLPWLGAANFEGSRVAPKLLFKVKGEDNTPIKLKVEINTAEIDIYDQPHNIKFTIDNPWFKGSTEIPTFTREEVLATKLRALLQRDKGRDLFDLSHSLSIFEGLDTSRLIKYFAQYLEKSQPGLKITRAMAEQRMFQKLDGDGFITDMRPLLTAEEAKKLTNEHMVAAFILVFQKLIILLPGEPWANTPEMIKKYGLPL